MKKYLIAALVAAAPLTAVVGQNWLGTVATTESGHRIGNPQAATKLVEFVSYTCLHCGHFFKEADGAIKLTLVQPGKGSVEVRHIIRDVVDLTATTLVNCGDKSKFWGNHDMFFSRQDEWLGMAGTISASQQRRWQAGPLGPRLQAVAGDLQFYDMMETRGYSRTEVDRCLSDETAVRALVTRTSEAADAAGVNSTPSFMVNGKLLPGVHSWAQLQKAL